MIYKYSKARIDLTRLKVIDGSSKKEVETKIYSTYFPKCPYCKDIWAAESIDENKRYIYRMRCKCGHAFTNSYWQSSIDEAVNNWSKFLISSRAMYQKDGEH